MNYLAIFIGGGLGSVVRFLVSQLSIKLFPSSFPIGTLISNTLACLIMGGVMIYLVDKPSFSLWQKQMILVGFCGGFSTFSTFSLETVQLVKSGNTVLAFLNVAISMIICFTSLFLLVKKTNN